jgi:large subunit ribosomal protein L25
MAHQFDLAAELRDDSGKGASRRLRRTGKVPGIMYGGDKGPQGISVDANALVKNMQQEAFFSSLVNVTLGNQKLMAIVRDYQMHPAKRVVLHLDLQRIVATEKLRISVPFHFINEALCKGVKIGGGTVSHLLSEVEISCLPADLPEYIEVDVGTMELNDMLHLSDITLPKGVEIPGLVKDGANDNAVVHVHVLRAEEEPAAATAEGAAEGAAAPAADAAKAGAKPDAKAAPAKGAAPKADAKAPAAKPKK